MASRTYIPRLVNLLRVVCKYIVRYRTQLIANGPATTGTKIDAIVTACEAFLAIVPADIPTE